MSRPAPQPRRGPEVEPRCGEELFKLAGVRCVTDLSVADLLEHGLGVARLRLRAGSCPRCLLPGAVKRLERTLKLAQGIVAAGCLGDLNLELTTSVSRRGILGLIRKVRTDTASPVQGRGRTPWRYKVMLMLLKASPSEEPIMWQGLPLGDMTVKKTCIVCGACARACDVTATWRKKKERWLELHHQPLLCSGCGHCVQVCPRGARELKEEIDLRELVGLRSRVVSRIEARGACKKCGGEALVGGYCPSCFRRARVAGEV